METFAVEITCTRLQIHLGSLSHLILSCGRPKGCLISDEDSTALMQLEGTIPTESHASAPNGINGPMLERKRDMYHVGGT